MIHKTISMRMMVKVDLADQMAPQLEVESLVAAVLSLTQNLKDQRVNQEELVL